jgi:hypothetical protein
MSVSHSKRFRPLIALQVACLLLLGCASSSIIAECPLTIDGQKECHRIAEEFCGSTRYTITPTAYKGKEFWGDKDDTEQDIWRRARDSNMVNIQCQ